MIKPLTYAPKRDNSELYDAVRVLRYRMTGGDPIKEAELDKELASAHIESNKEQEDYDKELQRVGALLVGIATRIAEDLSEDESFGCLMYLNGLREADYD